jgi:molybdopterin molybdotransferase
MISVTEARARLLEAAVPVQDLEIVALRDARGRVLAEPIRADRDFPPTDRSAMDGYAVRAADVARPGAVLRLTGEIRAGQAPERSAAVEPGCAVRILTGAIVPRGADAVVMVELTEDRGESVRILEAAEPGQHIRRRAEELLAGEPVLDAGIEIGPAQVAALAAVGAHRVAVRGRPRIGVLATGDEIVEVERAPEDHQVRNSNGAAVSAQLAECGIEAVPLGIAPDDPAGLRASLARGLALDGLVVTGGVSVGTYDLVAAQLTALGADLLFHGVAMRPGKPALAGRAGRTLALGLPGNPVSSFTALAILAAPALGRLRGRTDVEEPERRAFLSAPLRPRPGRDTYALARLGWSEGRPTVTPVRTAGSGDVLALARGNGFALAPAGTRALSEGTEVTVIPFGSGSRGW